MHAHDGEPLSASLWLREMVALADDCASSSLLAEDHAVRRAYYLSCVCPLALRTLLWPKFTESELEALLDQGSFEEAAELIIRQSGENLSMQFNPESGYDARIGTGDDAQAFFRARLPVLAMIGVWARFFSEPRKP